MPGLYGNQYELQIDVSRLPRPDQYNRILQAATSGGVVTPLSDMKNVAYYVLCSNDVGMGSPTVTLGGQQGGLVRRELDRAVSRLSADMGTLPANDPRAEPIAPEVVRLEFRYFDGTEWVTEWDSNARQGLPMAVEIDLWVQSAERVRRSQLMGSLAASLGLGQELDLTPYRLVVALPGAEPTSLDTETTSSEDSGSTDSGSTTSSGSSSSSSSGSSTGGSSTPGGTGS
ncbi:MAG: type II secretion system protein GspJ [Pirellulales bacterium]